MTITRVGYTKQHQVSHTAASLIITIIRRRRSIRIKMITIIIIIKSC